MLFYFANFTSKVKLYIVLLERADFMSVGTRIKELRAHCKISSQEELAYLVGTSRQSVSAWERDVFAPQGANLMKLAKVLNTSANYIMSDSKKTAIDSVPLNDNEMTSKLDISYSLTARQASTVFVSAEKSDGHKTVRYDLPPDVSANVLPLFEMLWKEIEEKLN